MRISDVMTSDVRIANPDQTIREAARIMAECDCGVLPVGDHDRLVGMITDRDIAIRAVAAGKSPDTPVRDIMSTEVLYCYEEEEGEDVVNNMADIQGRRLPVLNGKKRLVGLGSVAAISMPESR